MNILFKVLSTKIFTFCLLHVISISVKIIVESAKAIYGHLWAHKSYVLILEMCLLHIYYIRCFLSSITVQCIYGKKKKEVLYQIWSLTKQKQASPVVMAAAGWFIIEGRMKMCSLWKNWHFLKCLLSCGFFNFLRKRNKSLKNLSNVWAFRRRSDFHNKVPAVATRLESSSDCFELAKHFRILQVDNSRQHWMCLEEEYFHFGKKTENGCISSTARECSCDCAHLTLL